MTTTRSIEICPTSECWTERDSYSWLPGPVFVPTNFPGSPRSPACKTPASTKGTRPPPRQKGRAVPRRPEPQVARPRREKGTGCSSRGRKRSLQGRAAGKRRAVPRRPEPQVARPRRGKGTGCSSRAGSAACKAPPRERKAPPRERDGLFQEPKAPRPCLRQKPRARSLEPHLPGIPAATTCAARRDHGGGSRKDRCDRPCTCRSLESA